MADHEANPSLDQLPRRLDRPLQTAGVVDRDQGDLLAEHATALVQVTDRHLRGDPVALPSHGVGAGERICEPDQDFRRDGPGCGDRQRDG